jgi:peroxiredoxin
VDQTLFGILLMGLIVSLGAWLGCRLLRQNGRILTRLDALEEQVAHQGTHPRHRSEGVGGAGAARPAAAFGGVAEEGHRRGRYADPGQRGGPGNRSLADSKINRSGLPAGTPAPGFRLPCALEEGELSLEEFRGRRVLLVFSDPRCGPCNTLMPQLERQHRASSEVGVLMVSRGDREANRAMAEEHGLTFPIVLQRQWEISRAYGIFATPVAYLLDEQGILASDVAVGTDAILALLPETPPPSAQSSLATLAIALARGERTRRQALRQFGLALASALLASLGMRNAWSQENPNPCATACAGLTDPNKQQKCLAGCNSCLQEKRTPCGASPSGAVICVDLQSDVQNCGACGIRCPEGQLCVEGKCLPAPPCPKHFPSYDPVWNVCCPKQFPLYDPVRNVCVQCRDQSDCGANEQCCNGECVPAKATCCGTIVCPEGFPFCAEPNLCCTDPNRFRCTTRGRVIRSGSVINL